MEKTVPRAYLTARYPGADEVDVWALDAAEEVTLGRHQSNRVVLKDKWCSRQHARIWFEGGRWWIEDLGSRNGTFVNNEQIEGVVALCPGDAIRIGQTVIVFGEDLSAVPPSQRPTIEELDAESVVSTPEETGLHVTARLRPNEVGLVSARGLVTDKIRGYLVELLLELQKVRTREELAALVMRGVVEGIKADCACLMGVNGSARRRQQLSVWAQHGDVNKPYSRYLAQLVLEKGEGVLAQDIAANTELASRRSIERMGATSTICVPVRCGDRIVAVLHVYRTDRERPLGRPELEFVATLAEAVGRQLEQLESVQLLERNASALRDSLRTESLLIGQSSAIRRIIGMIDRVAKTQSTVLVRGESGVGKELVARAIHFNSTRANGPFVCLNCAALTQTLLESELFGHEKGAFTGATERKIGKFEAAHGGTIFLDEIGEMDPGTQAKLLRVLEGHPFERVGGGELIQVDVRVVAATNRPLEKMVQAGKFRRDLFFRIQVVEIYVPPLRERMEDVPLLAEHFLKRFASETGRRVEGFHPDAMKKLMNYQWPGNVRELKNVIERAVVLGQKELVMPEDIVLTTIPVDDHGGEQGEAAYRPRSLQEVEKQHIADTLDYTNWNKSRAAAILGIERCTLDRKLKRYGIQRP